MNLLCYICFLNYCIFFLPVFISFYNLGTLATPFHTIKTLQLKLEFRFSIHFMIYRLILFILYALFHIPGLFLQMTCSCIYSYWYCSCIYFFFFKSKLLFNLIFCWKFLTVALKGLISHTEKPVQTESWKIYKSV